MNFMIGENVYYCHDPYGGHYDPAVRFKAGRRSAYAANATPGSADIDESVKHLIQLSREQIAKEKEINTSGRDPRSEHHASLLSPIIGDTNRLSKHVVDILENIYQTSTFINRKRREEIAEDLNLPVEKVRNWFQNRRGKDRRLNQVQQIASRKYIRSGKYTRKAAGSDDFYYYDQRQREHVSTDLVNVPPAAGGPIRYERLPSPDRLEPIVLTFADHSPPAPGTMPYWPASNWNSEDSLESDLRHTDCSRPDSECPHAQPYSVVFDSAADKSFTVLRTG